MLYLLNLTSAVSPVPEQEDGLRPGLDPDQVTPGVLGFLFTLLMVVAVIFLIRDMARRVRRVRYRAMVEEAAMTEAGSADGGFPDPVPGSAPGPDRGRASGTDTRSGSGPETR